MECASEFRELANHNSFVSDLELQGYHVDFVNGYFVVYGIPYLDVNGDLQHGDWLSPVDLNGWVIDPPTSHQAWFRGGRPHRSPNEPIRLGGGAHAIHVADGFVTDHSFSFKLQNALGQLRSYGSFEEKVTTYLDAITAPALDKFPNATPLRAIEFKAADQGTSLRYPDSMSARYEINDIALKLKGKSIAVIGLGGTGSYILDFLSKTHVDRISLYDADKIHVHTIFRIPGFIYRGIGRHKVEALAEYFGQMHSGIEAHPERITNANIGVLDDFNFVFVAVDDPESRGEIIEHLARAQVPYVDCGMGLTRSVIGLNGMVRVSGTDYTALERTRGTAYLPTAKIAQDEYKRQPQIAELNALNAALAVIRFKQHFELYDLIEDAVSVVFETCSYEIDRLGVLA
jgi:hypothetical protein